MKVDIGSYNSDPDSYQKLIDELYAKYPGVNLPPEYDYFIQENLIRLLIRLARYKFIARLVKKTDRVLEVGCGSGIGSIFLSQHCRWVTGLEVKETEIREARTISRRKNVEFIAGDLFKLGVVNRYDVVCALDVIEHMQTEDGRKLIATMARHLKHTGMVVIGTPSIYSYEYQGPLSKASHVKCYDQQELLSLVGDFFGRTLAFSMNDEIVHTGFPKMAWYYFVLGFIPREGV